jgi:hypothetical protein
VSEAGVPAPPRLAASYALGICGIGVIIVLWMRGLLRPLLPVLLLVAFVLIVRRVIKAITAPVD